MDRTKEEEVTNNLVKSMAEDFVAEIDYSFPHASPKDIERNVNYALVAADADDIELDYEQKYDLYRTALGKMKETIRTLF